VAHLNGPLLAPNNLADLFSGDLGREKLDGATREGESETVGQKDDEPLTRRARLSSSRLEGEGGALHPALCEFWR